MAAMDSLARQLERELNEAKREVERLAHLCALRWQTIEGEERRISAERAKVANLREALEAVEICEEHSGKSANREWANIASMWLHPGEAVANVDATKIRQALADTADRAPHSPDSPASVDAQT